MKIIRQLILSATLFTSQLPLLAAPAQHTVSVTLNYDFTVDNACSSSVTTACLKQFNIYDTTGGGPPVNSPISNSRKPTR
jgi:hypothetical protein